MLPVDTRRLFTSASLCCDLIIVTDEQISTLFWINVLVGAILTMVAVALEQLLNVSMTIPATRRNEYASSCICH